MLTLEKNVQNFNAKIFIRGNKERRAYSMELLNKQKTGKVERPVKVLQFGEGNFLRAFVDYMIDIAVV